ncbi:MAG TPA: hypothetical protein VLA56_14385 [Pseudomonadales bacterium]|nr:hypothetical protein [Pseudomonadales bacterium]
MAPSPIVPPISIVEAHRHEADRVTAGCDLRLVGGGRFRDLGRRRARACDHQ